MILEALVAVHNSKGKTIFCVCDNCKTNVAFYGKLGGPAKRYIEAINYKIFLIFDYIHLHSSLVNRDFTLSDSESGQPTNEFKQRASRVLPERPDRWLPRLVNTAFCQVSGINLFQILRPCTKNNKLS